jgi:hypothetical protein
VGDDLEEQVGLAWVEEPTHPPRRGRCYAYWCGCKNGRAVLHSGNREQE